MPARNGKIANLPNDIREQLNLRLLEGETGRELAAWLNALPAVQSVLGSQFNGSPISEVNLTHWRQGGYLQWLTERECFDSARALADGDCDLAGAGLSAERLLNILTVRFGQLLMRWDFSPDEGVSESAEPIGVGAGVDAGGCPGKGGMSRKEASAFSEVARKARILQGISRSVLAIHRIQSQSAREKSGLAAASANSPARFEKHASPSTAAGESSAGNTETAEPIANPQPEAPSKATTVPERNKSAIRNPQSEIDRVLSGPTAPLCVPLDLSHSPFRADPDLSEVLDAV